MSFLPFGLHWKLLISFVKTYLAPIICLTGFPGSSADKESPWNAGDPGSILGLGGSPGEGIGYLPQYSGLPWWLKNPPAMQETWVWSLGWEDPLEEGNPFPYSCLENPHGQRSLVATDHSLQRVGCDWATKHSTAHLPDTGILILAKIESLRKGAFTLLKPELLPVR